MGHKKDTSVFNSRIIAFDIDDTVADFATPCLELLNKKFNKNISKEDLTHYNLHEHFGVTMEELVKLWKHDCTYENLRLRDPWIPYWFKTCKTFGFKVWLMSNRGHCMKDAATTTKNWCIRNNLTYDRIVILENGSVPKASEFTNDVVCLFDDNPLQVKEAHNFGVQSFLIDQPWNRSNNEALLPRLANTTSVQMVIQSLFATGLRRNFAYI
jgi:uncharacterized HAD superfamily protein